MARSLHGMNRFLFRPESLVFAGLLAFSAVSADPGPPPPAGKQYQDEAQAEGRGGPFHRTASAVVRDFYDELGQGDLPGMLEDFAKDAKWVLYGPSGIPFAGVHEGREGIRAFIESFGRNAKVTRFEPKEFLADKRKVVVHGYEEATATPTGKAWKAHWTHSFTVERGKIVLVEEVLDTAPVLAAFQP
jgi:uncharacterized protein